MIAVSAKCREGGVRMGGVRMGWWVNEGRDCSCFRPPFSVSKDYGVLWREGITVVGRLLQRCFRVDNQMPTDPEKYAVGKWT